MSTSGHGMSVCGYAHSMYSCMYVCLVVANTLHHGSVWLWRRAPSEGRYPASETVPWTTISMIFV